MQSRGDFRKREEIKLEKKHDLIDLESRGRKPRDDIQESRYRKGRKAN